MGCFMSSRVQADTDDKDAVVRTDEGSCEHDVESDTDMQSITKYDRLGIRPMSFSSSSDSSGKHESTMNQCRNVRTDISDDESSIDTETIETQAVHRSNLHQQFGSPDATLSNQSMGDFGDESVVDWLAESESTTLFTSTSAGDEEERHSGYKTAFSPSSPTAPTKVQNAGIPEPGEHFIIKSFPDSAILADEGSEKHVVKDTTRVERRHVRLPTCSTTPPATKGDWIRHRYVVNDYIVLSSIGTGAHSEVRRGDLMNMRKKDVSIARDDNLRGIIGQVMDGLRFLHLSNVTHNDLKPSNILVNADGIVKLADFGVSGLGRVRLDSAGTPAFMSPEVVCGDPHDGQLADCYSLGATIFCVKFGRPPFVGRGATKNQRLLDLYDQIKHTPLGFPDPAVDQGLKDLIFRLMHKDPTRRMRLLEAQKHPWLQR